MFGHRDVVSRRADRRRGDHARGVGPGRGADVADPEVRLSGQDRRQEVLGAPPGQQTHRQELEWTGLLWHHILQTNFTTRKYKMQTNSRLKVGLLEIPAYLLLPFWLKRDSFNLKS